MENTLKKRGAQVQSLHLYETVCPEIPSDHPVTVGDGDYILFTSGSTAQHFFESSFYDKQIIISVCIGEETMKVVKKHVNQNIILATNGDIINALKRHN